MPRGRMDPLDNGRPGELRCSGFGQREGGVSGSLPAEREHCMAVEVVFLWCVMLSSDAVGNGCRRAMSVAALHALVMVLTCQRGVVSDGARIVPSLQTDVGRRSAWSICSPSRLF